MRVWVVTQLNLPLEAPFLTLVLIFDASRCRPTSDFCIHIPELIQIGAFVHIRWYNFHWGFVRSDSYQAVTSSFLFQTNSINYVVFFTNKLLEMIIHKCKITLLCHRLDQNMNIIKPNDQPGIHKLANLHWSESTKFLMRTTVIWPFVNSHDAFCPYVAMTTRFYSVRNSRELFYFLYFYNGSRTSGAHSINPGVHYTWRSGEPAAVTVGLEVALNPIKSH